VSAASFWTINGRKSRIDRVATTFRDTRGVVRLRGTISGSGVGPPAGAAGAKGDTGNVGAAGGVRERRRRSKIQVANSRLLVQPGLTDRPLRAGSSGCARVPGRAGRTIRTGEA
jgi:hypothetical protein